jgi:hypothetical protein
MQTLRHWERIWKESRTVSIVLCGATTLCILYFQARLPLPGVAIAVLGAVAAIMSLRPEMRIVEKAAWMLIISALLFTEIRAIRKDRTDAEAALKADRKSQDDNFQAIRTKQNSDFDATAIGLKAAVDGLNTNLGIAAKTFQQTEPHAYLLLSPFVVTNGPVPPAMFKSNIKYGFNFSYTNNGSEQALLIKRLGRIYIAKPDSVAAQEAFAQTFENDWKRQPKAEPAQITQAGGAGFWSEIQAISEDDEKKFSLGYTVYVVRRIEYRDGTGTWFTDQCDHYQLAGNRMDLDIVHPCFVLMNGRYRAKQH